MILACLCSQNYFYYLIFNSPNTLQILLFQEHVQIKYEVFQQHAPQHDIKLFVAYI